jgi:flagellar biogenesis protein FliO
MGDYSYMLLRTVLALGLVIVLMVGAMYAVRSLSGRMGTMSGRSPVRVLARSFLGQKSSIAIVEVGGEVLVLGISMNAVNLLARIDDEDVIRGLRAGGAGRKNGGAGGGRLSGIISQLGRVKK